MGIGQSKEGFSVYGLMNKCVSSMGKRQLRIWFLRPIINLEVLEERQNAIAEFLREDDVMNSLQVGSSPQIICGFYKGPHVICK